MIGAVAGLAGGAAFAIVQALDMRAFGYQANDYTLLGGLIGRSRTSSRRIGIAIHTVNSAALGAIYGLTTVGDTRIPGPAKGIIFGLIENTMLYPVVLLEGRHPLIKSGELPSFRTWTAYTQETLRHVAFGAATGAMYSTLSKRRT
jgi:hypothetical protein